MSFDIDVTLRQSGKLIAAAFRSEAPATALFGPSGVGKTSVLMMIAGLVRPDHGHVRVGDRTLFDGERRVDVAVEQRGAGVVFQETRLFPHLSVRRNLLYGARGDAMLADTAAMLDVDHLLDRWPRTLSGGEARRVAIARALLREPAFLLLDEPTASLDQARREEVLGALEQIRDVERVPILLVTHDRGEAERIAGGAIVAL